MSAVAVVQMPVREAYPDDVAKDPDLSAPEKLVYMVLAGHNYHPKKHKPDPRPYDGIVWLRRPTICEEASLSDATVRRAINGLLAKHRICLPEGDSGGRSRALKYHLHPDGCDCGLPKVELKQRKLAVAGQSKRASNSTPFLSPERPSNSTERASNSAEKGVNMMAASNPLETISTPTTREQPKPPEPLFVVASPSLIEKSQEIPSASQEEKIQEGKTAPAVEKQPSASELAEELRKPEIIAGFEQLQRLVQDPIWGYGKRPILQAAREHGFTLEELGSAFRAEGQGLKRAGGLIKFATEIFPQHRQNGHAPRPIRTYSKEQIASSFRRDPAYQTQAGTLEAETVSPERIRELQDEAQYSHSEVIRQLARQRLLELQAEGVF